MPVEEVEETRISPSARLRAMQLVTAVLTAGPVSFGVLAIFMALGEEPQLDPQWTAIGAAASALAILASLVMPSAITKAARQKLAAQAEGSPQEQEAWRIGHLYAIYQIKHIVGLALLEGAALINIVFFMLTGQMWMLAMAAAPIAMMAASFPWKERVELWVQEQSHLIEMRR